LCLRALVSLFKPSARLSEDGFRHEDTKTQRHEALNQ
jgi:hypothetical protein